MDKRINEILSNVLMAVETSGWTEQAFRRGVRSSGVSTADAKRLLPEGIADIIESFFSMIDEGMLTRIKGKRNFRMLRIREKVGFAVRSRFEVMEPYKAIIQRILVRGSLPAHVLRSAQRLWQTADAIWLEAGDTATDYNRYTKRLLLIGVIKTTLAFWLQDVSKGHGETWEFLDRRIDNVMTVGKGMSVIKTVGISDIVSVVKSVVRAKVA